MSEVIKEPVLTENDEIQIRIRKFNKENSQERAEESDSETIKSLIV
jgi:hypothetical protein